MCIFPKSASFFPLTLVHPIQHCRQVCVVPLNVPVDFGIHVYQHCNGDHSCYQQIVNERVKHRVDMVHVSDVMIPAWNWFRNWILSLFQKYMIPIPIPVPTAPGTNSKMELVPRRKSIPQLDLDPGLESVPLIQLALQIGQDVVHD